jgi:hypothetical protein
LGALRERQQMESSEQGAGTTRSGRDRKCPQCGANNRADSEWCWQCLERFPALAPEETPSSGESGGSRGGTQDDGTASVDPAPSPPVGRDAPSEPSDVVGEDAAPRFSTLIADGSPAGSPVETNGHSNGSRATKLEGETLATAVGDEPKVEAVIEGERGAIEIKGREITWTCSRCETVNSFERNICEVCGATFAEVIKEPDEKKPERDPNTVALVSLFFPGAGHAYLGMWGQAVARGVISLWVVATAIFAAAQGATQSMIMAVVFGLMSFALWAVSAHDSYREARGEKRLVLLRDKLFLYLVLGLLLLSVMMVFSMVIGARG